MKLGLSRMYTTSCLTSCEVSEGCIPLYSLQVRAIISDFAVFITILTMVLVDYALGIPSPKLQVPNKFKVSSPLKLPHASVLFITLQFTVN